MPGWTVTDWSTNPDWALATRLNEFVDAVNERLTAAGMSDILVSAVEIGDDVQGATGVIFQCQQAIEMMYGQFLVSHDAGVKRDLDYWSSDTTAPSADLYFTLSDLFVSAGLGTPTWRRYIDAPESEGGTPEIPGKVQVGDLIGGAWMFDDLMKVLNALVYRSSALSDIAVTNGSNQGIGTGTTWAEAQSDAVTDWNSGDNIANSSTATAYSSGGNPSSDLFGAEITRCTQKASIPGVSTDRVRRVAWYVYATNTGGVWDNQGDACLSDLWKDWLTENYDAAANTETSFSFGASVTMPTWCDEPVFEGTSAKGYTAASPLGGMDAVISWDVAGGFTYR